MTVARNYIASTDALWTGIHIWPGNVGTGVSGTRLLFSNNTVSANAGITIVPGTFTGVSCLAINNDMSQTTTPYAWDNASTPCKVVGNADSRMIWP